MCVFMSGTIIANPTQVNVYSFNRQDYPTLKGSITIMSTYPQTSNSKAYIRSSIWSYLGLLNTAESWLLRNILDHRNFKNNTANVVGKCQTEKNYIKLGYTKLFEDGWVARIKRGYYMLNPAVIETHSSVMVDAILLWNAHCHNDAVIEMPAQYQLTTFDMDTAHLLDLIKQGEFKATTDSELQSLLNFMRTAKWLDANNVFTDRKPSTATHAQHIVDECKTRGLI